MVSLKNVELKGFRHSITRLYGPGSEHVHSCGKSAGLIRSQSDGEFRSLSFDSVLRAKSGSTDFVDVFKACEPFLLLGGLLVEDTDKRALVVGGIQKVTDKKNKTRKVERWNETIILANQGYRQRKKLWAKRKQSLCCYMVLYVDFS